MPEYKIHVQRQNARPVQPVCLALPAVDGLLVLNLINHRFHLGLERFAVQSGVVVGAAVEVLESLVNAHVRSVNPKLHQLLGQHPFERIGIHQTRPTEMVRQLGIGRREDKLVLANAESLNVLDDTLILAPLVELMLVSIVFALRGSHSLYT